MAENHDLNHLDEQPELKRAIHQIYLAFFSRKKEGLEKLTALVGVVGEQL